MRTKAPTQVVFTISTILGAAALISQFVAKLPIVSGYEFITLAVAFVLLWLGVVLRGF